MGEAGRTAAARRAIDAELAALRFHWGEAYQIEFDDEHGWRARRLDELGGWLTTATPDGLCEAITEDYTLRPVPRRCAPDVGDERAEIRLKIFRDQHPEWRIFPGEFGTWQAERDTDHGSDTHVRYRLSDLLDVLEEKQ